jgi:hypothetical protein
MEQQLGPAANGHMPPDPVHVSPQTAGTGFAASVGMFLSRGSGIGFRRLLLQSCLHV